MQLFRYKDRLLVKFKMETRLDFEQLPPIREALSTIQGWNRQERETQGKPPIRHRSATKEKRTPRPIRDIPSEVVPSHLDEPPQPAAKNDEAELVPSPESLDGESAIVQSSAAAETSELVGSEEPHLEVTTAAIQ